MLTLTEKQQLQKLLNYLSQQKEVMEYPDYQKNVEKKNMRSLDVSHRLRDQQGRFLPSMYTETEESSWILDNPQTLRKLKIEPIAGTYNSYLVKEKIKRDWSGNIYLFGLLGLLIITYLT